LGVISTALCGSLDATEAGIWRARVVARALSDESVALSIAAWVGEFPPDPAGEQAVRASKTIRISFNPKGLILKPFGFCLLAQP
jgi:hypothetical protein